MPPKLPDTRLTIRLTPEERAALKAKAGGTPLSTYVRQLALGQSEAKRTPPRKAPVKDHVALAQILALLGRPNIFSSLHGLDRAAELGLVDLDDESHAEIRRTCNDLCRIKSLLMRALGVQER